MSYLSSTEFILIHSKFAAETTFIESDIEEDISTLNNRLITLSDFHERSYVHFTLGLLYGELAQTKKKGGLVWDWTQKEIEAQTSHYWSALFEIEKYETLPEQLKPQKAHILANIANMLSNIGRCVEAITYYNKALELSPKDPQIVGNIGTCLKMYAVQLYDPGHQTKILSIAAQKLMESIANPTLFLSAKSFFENELRTIHDNDKDRETIALVSQKLSKDSRIFFESTKEQVYWNWALSNNLFLNPLNDLGPYPIAGSDPIHLPTIRLSTAEVQNNKQKLFQGFINTIKED